MTYFVLLGIIYFPILETSHNLQDTKTLTTDVPLFDRTSLEIDIPIAPPAPNSERDFSIILCS